jgi:membrane protease YdiL (CAAX protease family)
MNRISGLADKKPLVFVILALLAWLGLGTVIVFVAASLFQVPITDPHIQEAGTLGATGVLLLLASRLGWLRKIGVTAFGTWTIWALTLLLGCYLVLSGFYSFFGEVTFDIRSLFGTQEARAILLRQPIVGFVEETMFRGILLYALVRVWGQTRRGLVAAVVVQAALFGTIHALQIIAGSTLANAVANVLNTFVFGVWLGMLVLSVASLWPAIVLHAVSNAFMLIKGLNTRWVDPVSLGYIRAALFDFLLVLVGLWIILRVRPVSVASSPKAPGPSSAA